MDVEKRETILDAAVRAFERLGFRKASIDAIAQMAGVAKGTIYLACESKKELFYQAVHRDLRSWLGEVSRVLDPRAAADELLLNVAMTSITFLTQRPLVRDLLLGKYHENIPDWADQFDQLRDMGRANLVEILRIGVRQGRFRSDIPLDETAEVLQDMHLAAYLFTAQVCKASIEDVRRRFEIGFDLVLNGLRVRETPTEAIA